MGDILVNDYVLGGLVAGLAISILLFIRIRSFLGGKYFISILKATARRFRNPVQRINLFKGNYYEIEIMDVENVTEFDKAVSSTPVSIDENHAYRSPAPLRTYFFAQGYTTNINPIITVEKLYELLRRIGLLNNKYLDYKEQRMRSKWADKLLDKDHFNKISLLIIIGIAGSLFLLFNLTTFAQGAQALYESWLPIIEQQFKDVPRLVEGKGFSLDEITKSITNPGG